jgi:maleylpyruvate isomerase
VRLYGYWRSSSTWRVRIALHWKGLGFEYRPVNLLRGEQRTDAYQALNPAGAVPLLEVSHPGGVTRLRQSMAILEFLEERHPAPPLLPADPVRRAQARMLAEQVNAGIQPFQNLAVLQHLEGLGADPKDWARTWIASGLRKLQALSAPLAGRYLVGDELTVADLFLVPQLYAARRFGVDLGPLGLLTQVEVACVALPAFQNAHPDVQPDADPPRP